MEKNKHMERNQKSDILETIHFTKYSSFIFINETVANPKKITFFMSTSVQ